MKKEKYCLHFIILKPIEYYFHIDQYEKIHLTKQEITDQYITINGKTDVCLTCNVKILRFPKVLIFKLLFQTDDETLFGTAEFEIKLSQIMNLQK